MVDKPDWALGQFTPEAIEAKSAYYTYCAMGGAEGERERQEREERSLEREARRLERPRPNHERDTTIWRERKEAGTTYRAIGEKHGVSVERVRQIVARLERDAERRKFFNERRERKEQTDE
jgi:Sigma-70, region 4